MERDFETVLLEDAIRRVNIRLGDNERALEEVIAKGARIATYSDLVS